jgi:hypothetical protein
LDTEIQKFVFNQLLGDAWISSARRFNVNGAAPATFQMHIEQTFSTFEIRNDKIEWFLSLSIKLHFQ